MAGYRKAFKNKEQFLSFYEKDAQTYDEQRSVTFEGKRVDLLQIQLLKSIFKRAKAHHILEAGCGTGRLLIPMHKAGFDCTGFDASEKMLYELRRKCKRWQYHIPTMMGDIEAIPHDDETFDAVYSVHVLMHMPDFKQAFREMHRVTKKGGMVVCDFPNRGSPWTMLALLINPFKKRTKLYTMKEIRGYFKKYNYQITGLFSYPRTLYQIPVLKNIAAYLEDHFPLPVSWRTQLFVIVKKR